MDEQLQEKLRVILSRTTCYLKASKEQFILWQDIDDRAWFVCQAPTVKELVSRYEAMQAKQEVDA